VVQRRDGSEIGKLTRIPSGFTGIFQSPGTPADLSEIEIQGLRESEVAYSSTTLDVPLDAVKAQSEGIEITRAFFRITPKGMEAIDFATPLHGGDTVVSETRVKRKPTQGVSTLPSQFLVIEDGVPSLAEAIDNDESYLADAKIVAKNDTYWGRIKQTQRSPQKTVRIAKVLPGAELKTYQVWRIAFTGTAGIPPARAFDMYDESLQGNTQAQAVMAR
jgi:alpha-2-macroglobulin